MEKFQLRLSEKHFISIGKITAYFNILEQLMSFCIWSLIQKDERIAKVVASAWGPSEIETILQYTIFTPISLERLSERLGQIVTAELSFRQKTDLLGSLYLYWDSSDEKLAELKELLGRVSVAEQKRNTITHSLWAADTTEETITRVKPTAKRSPGWKLQLEPMSVQDLDKVADSIAEVAYDVQTFAIRIYDPKFRK